MTADRGILYSEGGVARSVNDSFNSRQTHLRGHCSCTTAGHSSGSCQHGLLLAGCAAAKNDDEGNILS